ncbi:MAG: CRISPR-associated endonuclease Cas2 [Candidatus Bathyarchaeia archaeon]
MRYLVIYDITDDNLRIRVAETLKDYGLIHIQYSAFLGCLRRDKLNSLIVDLRRLIGDAIENVQIYPLCDLCFRGRKIIGKPKRYEVDEENKRPKFVYF